MAFRHGRGWSVVAWNEGPTQATFGLALPGRRATARQAVATSPTAQLSTTTRAARDNAGIWVLDIAHQTIVTYTFG